MDTQSTHERWLHLRWCHYYQWKNLLINEQESRRQLEEQHQQQTSRVLLLNSNREAAPLVYAQLVSLAQLRAQLQQKRAALRAFQTRQMDDFQQELVREGSYQPVNLFNVFSVLRQP